ncbi:MAG: hypothetical protein LLG00_15440, partial [Planctomycetaceae bacterium]|nr:hypothetical protein [Planctomycetaceae bacterium]
RLNQTTPQGHPVWRLAIVAGADMGKDLNDPDDSLRPTIERSVYFVDPGATITGDGRQYYPSATNVSQAAPILPGRYAVIGPAATTHVGVRTDGGALTTTRQIVLTENVDPNDSTDQVAVTHNANTASATNEVSAVPIKPPVAVVVDQPRRLSVSEPVDGYQSAGYDGTTDTYSPALPSPLDTAAELTQTGTRANYKIVHLQRLANPRLPWNETANMDGTLPANYNPYITIDSQPIDLTAFNGIAAEPAGTGTVMFASHQRGETNAAGDGVNNLWKQLLTAKPVAATPVGDNTHRFDRVLQHSLGYLNTPFGTPRSDAIDPRDSATGWRSCRGDPDAAGPFPWLTWNNRPYVSPLELLQVSWAGPSQLLQKFNVAQGSNVYTTVPFPHLLNLFASGTAAPYEELHRILDYLRVPSPFVGTQLWASPTAAANSTGHAYHPPFNGISTYREPGKINLNTIYGDVTAANAPPVWRGLMAGFPYMNTLTAWQSFVNSRRPSGDSSANPLEMPVNQTSPTEFARPFRSFAGAGMIPSIGGTNNPLKPRREINGTLLREGIAGQPLFDYVSTNAFNNTSRNPYFRYQGLQRLSNLVTTRSNVYAVWITVGYFEVTPVRAPDVTRWPDGYQLGRELGMDTGQIERHRGFYIFDRTIPVGFKRGQDLNVEKAILAERFVE